MFFARLSWQRVARQTILEISRELPDDAEDEAPQSSTGDAQIEDARQVRTLTSCHETTCYM